MAEKGWSRTIRATYATQLGFEDRYGHRAVSFPPASLSAYHESRGESSNGKRWNKSRCCVAVRHSCERMSPLSLLSPLGTCCALLWCEPPGTGLAAPASGRSLSRFLGARPSWPLVGWKPALLAPWRRQARRRGAGGSPSHVICITRLGRGGPQGRVGSGPVDSVSVLKGGKDRGGIRN